MTPLWAEINQILLNVLAGLDDAVPMVIKTLGLLGFILGVVELYIVLSGLISRRTGKRISVRQCACCLP